MFTTLSSHIGDRWMLVLLTCHWIEFLVAYIIFEYPKNFRYECISKTQWRITFFVLLHFFFAYLNWILSFTCVSNYAYTYINCCEIHTKILCTCSSLGNRESPNMQEWKKNCLLFLLWKPFWRKKKINFQKKRYNQSIRRIDHSFVCSLKRKSFKICIELRGKCMYLPWLESICISIQTQTFEKKRRKSSLL